MFSIKPDPEQEATTVVKVDAPSDEVVLATNAPPAWPAVRATPPAPSESPARYNARVSLAIAAAFREAGVHVAEFSREVRVDGKVLVVDLVVAQGGREFPVFVLPGMDSASEARALHVVEDALARAGLFTGTPVTWYAPRAPVANA